MNRRNHADEDEERYTLFLGIGNAHAVAEPEADPKEEPGIWLPDHRSGSRFGGWHRRPITTPQRVIGFGKPR